MPDQKKNKKIKTEINDILEWFVYKYLEYLLFLNMQCNILISANLLKDFGSDLFFLVSPSMFLTVILDDIFFLNSTCPPS